MMRMQSQSAHICSIGRDLLCIYEAVSINDFHRIDIVSHWVSTDIFRRSASGSGPSDCSSAKSDSRSDSKYNVVSEISDSVSDDSANDDDRPEVGNAPPWFWDLPSPEVFRRVLPGLVARWKR